MDVLERKRLEDSRNALVRSLMKDKLTYREREDKRELLEVVAMALALYGGVTKRSESYGRKRVP